jgi:hypothetical protein
MVAQRAPTVTGREHGQEPERERYVVSAERFRQAYESPEVRARLARAKELLQCKERQMIVRMQASAFDARTNATMTAEGLAANIQRLVDAFVADHPGAVVERESWVTGHDARQPEEAF